MSQLDLFVDARSTLPPAANTYAFPLSRRRKLVVKTAETLARRKTQAGREQYWARLIRELIIELKRLDTSKAVIDQQLLAFHRAVEIELLRDAPQPMSPSGAA